MRIHGNFSYSAFGTLVVGLWPGGRPWTLSRAVLIGRVALVLVTFPTTMRVPPVPRHWGPGMEYSLFMRGRERRFWQAHTYDFNVCSHAKFVEKLRYIHRNPVVRGLVGKPEDWRWSSYSHYQTGMRGAREIESDWTAGHRGWQLPEWMRYRRLGSSSPVPKGEGPGAPSTE
jgi:hypothetical protein